MKPSSHCIFPAIALAGQAFETVIEVWIVTWHSITPLRILPIFTTTFRVYRSGRRPYLSDAEDVILPLLASMSSMLDQRYQGILLIISAW